MTPDALLAQVAEALMAVHDPHGGNIVGHPNDAKLLARCVLAVAVEACAATVDADANVWKPESTTGMALRRVAARCRALAPITPEAHHGS